MRTLDKYVIRQFLKIFLITVLGLGLTLRAVLKEANGWRKKR